MLHLVTEIGMLIGEWNANQQQLVPQLRRGNRIKTIQASLAIEQNTLSTEQVSAVIEGKMVLGSAKEIQEVQNAFAAYEQMSGWNPNSQADFLHAHRLLMYGLTTEAGQLRSGGVGIYREQQLVHMAPPANQLPRLMAQLFDWLQHSDLPALICSCAFHYELEFIHPFSDGNGRIGRLWQTVILSQWQPMLAYLPVETVIKHQQEQYYLHLTEADKTSDCTGFIEFMLCAIRQSLHQAVSTSTTAHVTVKSKVEPAVKTEDALLAILEQQPELSLREVAMAIGKSLSTIEKTVSKLKSCGVLRFEGARKKGRWFVQR